MSAPTICYSLLVLAALACAVLVTARPGGRTEFWSSVIGLAAIAAVPVAAAIGSWP